MHAHSSVAHGYFQPYRSLSNITKADFLSDPEKIMPVLFAYSRFRAMPDRGIPRSYRPQEGLGIHTFRLLNAEGKATVVRFHWKPLCREVVKAPFKKGATHIMAPFLLGQSASSTDP